jgi:dipeptidyl aminopeptidase/acylaminoacyl peptidase
MNRTTLVVATIVALASPAGATPKPSVKDFFRNPQNEGFQLSPSGDFIAFVQPYQNRLNVFVRKRVGGAITRVTSETERDIAGFAWKGDNRILYVKDFKGDENYHVVAVDRDGSHMKDLTPFDKVRAGLVDDLERDPTDILVAMNKRKPEVNDVYRLNVVTGQLKLVAENPGNITGWMTDHAGALRIAIATDGVNNTLLYRDTEAAPFKAIFTTDFRETRGPLMFTPDNHDVYALSNHGRDKLAIVEMDPRTGNEKKVVFEHPDVDASALAYSEPRKTILYAAYETDKLQRKFFDADAEQRYKRVALQLPGYSISFTGSNRDETVYIVAAFSDRTRGARYVWEQATDKLTKLADVAPWLDEKQMSEMKPITYTSRDGLTIHGYLTLPQGKSARNLPLVLDVHGGPWVRDSWGFDSEVQFLASRGYAVLQVNYRGSTGYGRKFWESSFKQWGKKMNDDLTDAVKWAIAQGLVDSKKVCIYGGSYGGYATLAGLAFSPEVYACGIDYVGVSNLFTFMKTIPAYWKPEIEKLHAMVGDPDKDKELMTAASPVFHVDRIRAPLLVAQGKNDPRVNIDESNQIGAAIKKRGVDVQYMVKDNEGHGFHNEENQFDFYGAMETFLAKHLN